MPRLPCPPEHWTRFSDLLDKAMDLPESGRQAWLNGLRGEDAELRPWLGRVLGSAATVSTSDFLQSPRLAPAPEHLLQAGQCIGPYRLAALLGEGGMGQVWRARGGEDGPQREVALKLPHPELLGGPFRQRFRRERDMLAALTHPNIAALYDAGVSAEGHPYLALELVDGRPITEFCRDTGATLERRVDLLRQVLAALAYAHTRLIVHRDIKPSNVLVTPDGQVKLLDFGIAKLLDATPTTGAEAPLTQPAAQLATPGYAPPEQLDGGTITVAADLYAAGVLLFELCTGQRPPRLHAGMDAPLASRSAAAGNPAMARRLRGDLDAIIAKALSYDPAKRYASGEAFDRDLRRWREGMPVSANRIGWSHLTAKFVRRNKVGVSLAIILALAIAGGTAAVAWQARRAGREAQRATAVKNFLINLFQQGDPHTGRGPGTMSVKELIDIGADQADAAFVGDPATEIELLTTLGNLYDAYADGQRSEATWSRRLDLQRKLYGPASPQVVEATLRLAHSEVEFEDEDKSRALLETIRAPVFSAYGPESLQRAQWLQEHADSLRDTHGGRDQALAEAQQAVAIYEAHFRDSPDYPDALEMLSDYQYDAEQCTASLATNDRMHAFQKANGGVDAMDEVQYQLTSGLRLSCLGRVQQADAALIKAADLAERQFGKRGLWYEHAVSVRALTLHIAGQRAQADALFTNLLGHANNTGDMTGQPVSNRRAWGSALAREGRAALAVPVLEQVLAQTRQHTRDEPNLRRTELMLGDAYDQVGRTAEARTLLLAARNEYLRFGNAGTSNTLTAEERWGRFLLDHGDAAAAATEFGGVIVQAHGTPYGAVAMAQNGLARIALAQGSLAEADQLTAAALRMLDTAQAIYDARMRVEILLTRAQVLRALHQSEAAHAAAGQALADALAWDDPASPQVARARKETE